MKNWKDIYKLPFKDDFIDRKDGFRSKRIVDRKRQFVFQFMSVEDDTQENILKVLNGVDVHIKEIISFEHSEGQILTDKGDVIMLIRGWGNLTGIGGHNLDYDEAANVQDTLADYIISRLNSMVNSPPT